MKTAIEMAGEISEHLKSDSNAEIFAMSIMFDAENEIESMVWEKPVHEIIFDHENEELILLMSPLADTNISAFSAFSFLQRLSVEPETCGSYEVCVSDLNVVDNYTVRIDRPLIGFGESENQMRFFVVVANDQV